MIFDAHCDALLKLHYYKEKASFQSKNELHITYPQLVSAGSKVQLFAIFLEPELKPGQRFQTALEMIEVFHKQILAPNPKMKLVKSKNDIEQLKEDEIGAMLTLEGCEAIEEDLVKLETLYQLGVRSVGLTWNWANAVADGALEPRAAGITKFGKEVIQFLNSKKMWTDVSHLCEKSFWDTLELAQYPIASHSNTYTLCEHPRNLKDEQIRALLDKNGVIGVTFVPKFLTKKNKATIADIIRHLDHICSLGGKDQVGLGSDFDGISETVEGLSSFKDYSLLVNELQKHYSEDQVHNILYKNFFNRLPQ
ncbi:membrane dipeptidase [Bacillus pakistanensis]|uniref:Membrane dipeptidase n=1 Tax=Rossellomorea pakistanensis TaxID=992288 RepID=A0ABS2NH81_9BACI|nr:dipeptidase [Bacillus pakistanensis]MBM7586916.1 membrane dipeptidase [Bacillus pakistanensis]